MANSHLINLQVNFNLIPKILANYFLIKLYTQIHVESLLVHWQLQYALVVSYDANCRTFNCQHEAAWRLVGVPVCLCGWIEFRIFSFG